MIITIDTNESSDKDLSTAISLLHGVQDERIRARIIADQLPALTEEEKSLCKLGGSRAASSYMRRTNLSLKETFAMINHYLESSSAE